jgi:hypothetical protein
MEYSKLVSITGLSGLYELIASKTDGAIIRSLDDKSTRFISSRVHNFSHLESIEVYTAGDNVNLVHVFHIMEKSNEPLPSEKDANAVKKYFEKVYPEMDFDRVYSSDMKKMIKWFDELKKNNIEIKLTEEEEQSAAEENNAEPISDELETGSEKQKKEEIAESIAEVKKEAAPKTSETEAAKKKITKK